MDPYLEDPAYWPDFHPRFINYWCERIADVLPDNYEARIGERVYVVEPMPGVKKQLGPDVTVTRTGKRRPAPPKSSGTATLEPATIPTLILQEVKEAYIKLIHRPGRDVVAVLELLSPTNKAGEGREIYLRKRHALMFQNVHLIELDLLLQGQPMPLAKPLPQGDYHYLVTRYDRRPNCDVYAWNLADRLPTVPVPLRAPDADVFCDLGTVFSTAYQRGRYRRAINYRNAPPVSLSAGSRRWVRQQVRAAER